MAGAAGARIVTLRLYARVMGEREESVMIPAWWEDAVHPLYHSLGPRAAEPYERSKHGQKWNDGVVRRLSRRCEVRVVLKEGHRAGDLYFLSRRGGVESLVPYVNQDFRGLADLAWILHSGPSHPTSASARVRCPATLMGKITLMRKAIRPPQRTGKGGASE